MNRSLIICAVASLMLVTSTANANTVESSTMWFQGALTDQGGGVYTGTIDMTAGKYYVPGGAGAGISTSGGFDVYAKQGAEAYVQGYYGTGAWNGPGGNDTYIIGYYAGSPHDAYPMPGGPWGGWYDPDCADWDKYALELTADHWYLRYKPTGESPMSGTMNWATQYAIESDLGTQDGGHDGSAAHGGGAGAWDWDCGWGVEVVPLEFSGFVVNITDLGGGNYEVSLTPSGYSATFTKRNWDTIPGSPFDGEDGTHDGKFGKRDDGVLGSGTGVFYVDEAVWAWYQAAGGYSDAWSDTGGLGGTDNRYTENRWKFTSVASNSQGYYLKVVARDLDNYAFQKPYSTHPTHWTGDPATGGRYKWPEEWEVETDIGATGTFTGTRVLLNIAPDATNGYVSTTTALLPAFTGGDMVIGINGTYFPDIDLPDWPLSYAWDGSQQHGIQLMELTLNPTPANTLWLNVQSPSLYVKTNENVVVDMDVKNLAQKVNACQAMLGYSSTYFQDPTAGCVAPGGGVWDLVIWDSWVDNPSPGRGEIDTAIGVDAQGHIGTDADGTVAIITLMTGSNEGTTQMVFRPDADPDPGLIESTYLSDMNAQPVWPSKFNSQTIVIDGTDPCVVDIAATQFGGPDLTPSGTAVQGVVNIAVATSDNLSGIAGAPTVTVTPQGASPESAAFVNEDPTNTFNYTWTVTSTTPNGTATITVSGLQDKSGNVAADVFDTFNVDKNQATGTVSMDTESSVSYSFNRDVVFKATDGGGSVLKTWTITVSFANNTGTKIASGSYTLTEVPGSMAGLSAKTAWSLRKKESVSLDPDGQAAQNFMLLGGDIDGSNSTNILDYSVLKVNWFTEDPVADINGDGDVSIPDYLILKKYFFRLGDAE